MIPPYGWLLFTPKETKLIRKSDMRTPSLNGVSGRPSVTVN